MVSQDPTSTTILKGERRGRKRHWKRVVTYLLPACTRACWCPSCTPLHPHRPQTRLRAGYPLHAGYHERKSFRRRWYRTRLRRYLGLISVVHLPSLRSSSGCPWHHSDTVPLTGVAREAVDTMGLTTRCTISPPQACLSRYMQSVVLSLLTIVLLIPLIVALALIPRRLRSTGEPPSKTFTGDRTVLPFLPELAWLALVTISVSGGLVHVEAGLWVR